MFWEIIKRRLWREETREKEDTYNVFHSYIDNG